MPPSYFSKIHFNIIAIIIIIITSGCPILAQNEYLMGHNTVGAHSHYLLCKALGKETTEMRYTHTHTHMPKPVCEHDYVTVLWIQEVDKNREVMENRPDIVIKNRKWKTCTLICVSITEYRNVIQKN